MALRKFGFTAGMAVFSVLTVDDLARVASKKLQETEATKGIGDMLAKEFRSAGVAMANDPGGDPYGGNPYNPPPSCAEQANAAEQACFDQVNANASSYWLPGSYDAAITACNDQWQRDMAACNGSGGGGGNPYGGCGSLEGESCTQCCQQARDAREMACYDSYGQGGYCGQYPVPSGNAGCHDLGNCIAAASVAQSDCEQGCTY